MRKCKIVELTRGMRKCKIVELNGAELFIHVKTRAVLAGYAYGVFIAETYKLGAYTRIPIKSPPKLIKFRYKRR